MQSIVGPTAGPGVTSSIPAQSRTFVEIDREIISMVILLLLLIQEGLLSITSKSMLHEILVNHLVKLCQAKVWLSELTFLT